MFSFRFLRRRGRADSSSETTLAKLGRVLNRHEPGADVASLLQDVPPSWPPERRQNHGPQALAFPLAAAKKIAVLRPGFTLPETAKEFAAHDLAGIQAWEPDALVVPLNSALLLADQKLRGKFDLPSLTLAITVVTRIDDSPLAPHHRDLLWRAFEVPVFEQLLGWDGAVIARECELHCGLHLAEETVIATVRDEELLLTHLNQVEHPIVLARTGYSATLLPETCDCGSTALRLSNLMPVRQRVRATE